MLRWNKRRPFHNRVYSNASHLSQQTIYQSPSSKIKERLNSCTLASLSRAEVIEMVELENSIKKMKPSEINDSLITTQVPADPFKAYSDKVREVNRKRINRSTSKTYDDSSLIPIKTIKTKMSTSSIDGSKYEIHQKETVMSQTLRLFTRNENSFTNENSRNHREYLTNEMIKELAKEHMGARIYKQKLKNLPCK